MNQLTLPSIQIIMPKVTNFWHKWHISHTNRTHYTAIIMVWSPSSNRAHSHRSHHYHQLPLIGNLIQNSETDLCLSYDPDRLHECPWLLMLCDALTTRLPTTLYILKKQIQFYSLKLFTLYIFAVKCVAFVVFSHLKFYCKHIKMFVSYLFLFLIHHHYMKQQICPLIPRSCKCCFHFSPQQVQC